MTVLQKNWKELIKPSSIEVTNNDNSRNKATITVSPLERGFGNTIGNALRRILLSSIGGFAVTSVKIGGILHEFSLIDGIKEDVVDIIMNIKSLIIDKATANPGNMHLRASGKSIVYAKDIELDAGIKILNPDLVICHIEDDSVSLNIDMTVEYGIGYALAGEKHGDTKDVSIIYLDALFNPVKKVAYRIENARIGQKTDYDKLIMDVETNGSISPEDAVGLGARIIQEQLSFFVNFDVINSPLMDGADGSPRYNFNENLLKKIDEMELSVRSYNCLSGENIVYIADLVQKTENEMLKLPNFGRKSLNELRDNLKAMGLNFGMNLDNIKEELTKELTEHRARLVKQNNG